MENVKLEKIFDYLEHLESENFYGKVLISFQNGHVVNVKLDLSLDLEQFRSED